MKKYLFLLMILTFIISSSITANISRSVINAFRGQILITKDALQPQKNDKESIALFKKQNQSAINSEMDAGGSRNWRFYFTAFFSKNSSSNLKLQFYTGEKLSAEKSLSGVDTSLQILEGDISITEADGIRKGKYTLKLTDDNNRGKKVVLATASLILK